MWMPRKSPPCSRANGAIIRRHLRHHGLVGLAAHAVAAVPLGQRHHAVRQRNPAADLRQRRPAAASDASGRAAPVRRSRRRCRTAPTPSACGSISGVQPVAASAASVSRSMISSSSPTSSATRARNSAPFSAARQASVAIRRARVTPLVPHLVAADRERGDRALDRRIAEAARAGNALAQPDDAGERVDHAEAFAGRPRHQQPAIIGAEIERGIGRPAPIAAESAARAVQATADPNGAAQAAPDRQRGRGPGCPRPRRSSFMNLPAAPELSPALRLRQCSSRS